MNDGCKGCKTSVRVSEESVKAILDDLLRDGTLSLVTEEEYTARLSTCRSCDHLDYATTCRFCGCLVQVRARLAEKHCPRPGAAGW